MPLNPLLRTSGVNYEPGELDLKTSSTGHLDFEVDVRVWDHPMTFRGFEGVEGLLQRACSVGTTHCRLSPFQPSEQSSDYFVGSLLIGRFAEVGRVEDTPFGPLTWMVTLENGGNLRGTLRVPAGPDGNPTFPGEITLGGRMVIVVQVDGAEPVTLRSRHDARQRGVAEGWPPYGTLLTMQGGPVEYFEEGQLTDPGADPVLSTEAARIKIMSDCRYLSTVPTIVDVTPVDGGGLVWEGGEVRAARVQWEEQSELVEEDGHEVVFDSYRIYRRPIGAPLESWELVGTVSWEKNFFIDTEFDAKVGVEYAVTRGIHMLFGYVFEGLFGPPSHVRALVGA